MVNSGPLHIFVTSHRVRNLAMLVVVYMITVQRLGIVPRVSIPVFPRLPWLVASVGIVPIVLVYRIDVSVRDMLEVVNLSRRMEIVSTVLHMWIERLTMNRQVLP